METYSCSVHVSRVILVFLLIATSRDLSAQHPPELGVSGPITTPVQHLPYWRLEEQLFGYAPRFTPGVVTFDPANHAYIRSGQTIQVLEDTGEWLKLSFCKELRSTYPEWDGALMTGPFAEEHVVFDEAGVAYTVANATRSNIKKLLLLVSYDRCRSWPISHELPARYARLERRDGHNDLNTPPAILLHDAGKSGRLHLIVPRKSADDTIELPAPILISEDCLLVPNHSGGGNSCITWQGKTHVVWPGKTIPDTASETAGTPEYAATYDRATGTLSSPVFLGFGGTGKPDAHNLPAIAVDSSGYLHVVLGAHHDPFQYTRSVTPGRIDAGWTKPVAFGRAKPGPSDGSYTYAGWLCDPDDNLHCVARWAGDGYRFRLVHLRKPAGKPWDEQRVLVEPFGGNYSVYYHKLNLDRRGRLFVNTLYTRPSRFADEVAAHYRKWPDRDATEAFLQHPTVMLTSGNAGQSWHLALSDDFRADVSPVSPAVMPPAEKPPLPLPLPSRPLRQFGGRFGPIAMLGPTAVIGVGRSLIAVDVSTPQAPAVISHLPPFSDTIFDILLHGQLAFVSAGNAGVIVVDMTEPRTPKRRGSLEGLDARHLDRVANVIYAAGGQLGLHVIDITDVDALRRLAVVKPATYSVAVAGGIAFTALGAEGLGRVDVSTPTTPQFLDTLFAPESYADRLNTAWFLKCRGPTLYVSPGPAPTSLRVYDVTAPRQPVEISRQDNTGWGWGRKTYLSGTMAVIPSLKGVHLLDYAIPEKPVLRGEWTTRGAVLGAASHHEIACVTLGNAGLAVLDISHPSEPKEIGLLQYPQVPTSLALGPHHLLIGDWAHGVSTYALKRPEQPARTWGMARERSISGVAFHGRFVLAAAGPDGVLVFTPEVDGATPSPVATLPTDSAVRDIATAGGILYVAEVGKRLRIVDIHELPKMEIIGEIELDLAPLSLGACRTVLAVGEMQYIHGGVRLFSIEAPTAPREIGWIDLGTDVLGVHLSETTAWAALGHDGLVSLDISDPAIPRLRKRWTMERVAFWDAVVQNRIIYAATATNGIILLSED